MRLNLDNKRTKERYERILQDGFNLFLKNGYKNTSLNDLVAQSGGSLSTIYKYFENKEGLFKAIVIEGIEKFSKDLETKININENLELEEFMFKFSEIYLNMVLSKKAIAFHRLILSEGFNQENKSVGEMFSKEVNNFLVTYLLNFFKKDEKTSKFSDDDLEFFATTFIRTIREPYFTNMLVFNKDFKLTQEAKFKHINKTIKMLLEGFLR